MYKNNKNVCKTQSEFDFPLNLTIYLVRHLKIEHKK